MNAELENFCLEYKGVKHTRPIWQDFPRGYVVRVDTREHGNHGVYETTATRNRNRAVRRAYEWIESVTTILYRCGRCGKEVDATNPNTMAIERHLCLHCFATGKFYCATVVLENLFGDITRPAGFTMDISEEEAFRLMEQCDYKWENGEWVNTWFREAMKNNHEDPIW